MVRETRNKRKAIQSMNCLLSEDMDIPGVMKENYIDDSSSSCRMIHYWKRMSQCQEIDHNYCQPQQQPRSAPCSSLTPPIRIDHTLQRAVQTLESLQRHTNHSTRGRRRRRLRVDDPHNQTSSRKRSKPSSLLLAHTGTIEQHENHTTCTMEDRQSSPCNGSLLEDNHHRCSPPTISASSSHPYNENHNGRLETSTTDGNLLVMRNAGEHEVSDSTTASNTRDHRLNVWNQSLSQELCAFETKLQAAVAAAGSSTEGILPLTSTLPPTCTGEQPPQENPTPPPQVRLDDLLLDFYDMKKRLLSFQEVDDPTTTTTKPSKKRRLSHEQLQQAPQQQQHQRPALPIIGSSTSRYPHVCHIQRRTPQRDISKRDAWLVQRRLLQLYDLQDTPSSSIVHFRTPPAG